MCVFVCVCVCVCVYQRKFPLFLARWLGENHLRSVKNRSDSKAEPWSFGELHFSVDLLFRI